MADLQKRGSYMPRRAKEQRAYRAVIAGTTTGIAGVITLVLAVAGVTGWGIPIVLLLLTAFFAIRFMSITGLR